MNGGENWPVQWPRLLTNSDVCTENEWLRLKAERKQHAAYLNGKIHPDYGAFSQLSRCKTRTGQDAGSWGKWEVTSRKAERKAGEFGKESRREVLGKKDKMS